jgi:hypothetical protein
MHGWFSCKHCSTLSSTLQESIVFSQTRDSRILCVSGLAFLNVHPESTSYRPAQRGVFGTLHWRDFYFYRQVPNRAVGNEIIDMRELIEAQATALIIAFHRFP